MAECKPLSPRMRQILECLAKGLTQRGAAVELGISHNTVKTVMTEIYNRLGLEGQRRQLLFALLAAWQRDEIVLFEEEIKGGA